MGLAFMCDMKWVKEVGSFLVDDDVDGIFKGDGNGFGCFLDRHRGAERGRCRGRVVANFAADRGRLERRFGRIRPGDTNTRRSNP